MTQSESVHITFSCAHEALVPAHLYKQNISNDEDILFDFSSFILPSRKSQVDLPNESVTIHTLRHSPCGRNDCYNISIRNLRRQILDRIDGIRADLAVLQENYTRLGKRYHRIPLVVRAKCANDPACAMTHLQFGITSIPWDQDAFFEPWMEVARYCSDLQRRVLSPCFDNGDKCVDKVSKTLVLCNRKMDEVSELIGMLRLGLEALDKAQKKEEACIFISGLPREGEQRVDAVVRVKEVLTSAGVANRKSLKATDVKGMNSMVLQCKSPSKAQRARKLLKTFKACELIARKYYSCAAVQQNLLPPIEQRFAVKDGNETKKRAFKNVIKAIWSERMSGFVSIASGRGIGQPWWLLP